MGDEIIMKNKKENKKSRKIKKNRKISNKIFSIVMIISITVFLVTGAVISIKVTDIVENLVKKELELEAEHASEKISSYLKEKQNTVNVLAKTDSVIEYAKATEYIKDKETVKIIPEYKALIDTFISISNSDEEIQLVYIGLDYNNNIITSDESFSVPDDFVMSTREWYKKAIETRKSHITNPYLDLQSGNIVISAISPVFKKDKVISAIGCDISISKLSEMLKGLDLPNGTYAFLIDGTGLNIYNPDEKKILKENLTDVPGKLGEIGKHMVEGKKGIEGYEYKGTEKYVSYSPVEKSEWSVGVTIPQEYIDSKTYGIKVVFIISFVLACLLLSFTVYFFTKRFFRPTKAIVENINSLAEYDLTNEINVNTNDEFGQIAGSIKTLQEGLRRIVENIGANASNTAATAEELTSTAQTTYESASEVADAVQNIADGASHQAEDTTRAAGNVEESSNSLNEMIEVIKSMEKATENIYDKKEEGKLALQELTKLTGESRTEAGFINDIILETNESAEAIAKASEMIQSIADQTNLLALNAAIEAARAGEAGKGFAVVAEEIRKLAEDSTKFTEEIRKIIQELKEKSQAAVDRMKNVADIVQKSDEQNQTTSEKFDMIEDALNISKGILDKLLVHSNTIEDKNQQLISVIENLSAIAEENAATTQEASASVDNQSMMINNISSASSNLVEIANDLQMEVSEFKL